MYYGDIRAVRSASIEIEPGQTVALLGANGAGKSSIIKALAGQVTARGTISFRGTNIAGASAARRVKLGIGTVPEGRGLFRSLTVSENLWLGAYGRRDRAAAARDLDHVFSLFPDLAQRKTSTAGNLSGGQAQMLALGRALMTAPRLLLLDEPSHGLAPVLVDEVFALIPRLVSRGDMAILLVEQNAAKALSAASYGYVLENGEILLEGPTKQLAHDRRVSDLYLGG